MKRDESLRAVDMNLRLGSGLAGLNLNDVVPLSTSPLSLSIAMTGTRLSSLLSFLPAKSAIRLSIRIDQFVIFTAITHRRNSSIAHISKRIQRKETNFAIYYNNNIPYSRLNNLNIKYEQLPMKLFCH